MASKSNGVDHSDWVRTPPTSGPFCVRLGKTIFDPEEKTFLGRTAKRWGIVFAFYLVFYAVLALMFAACMAGLFYSLPPDRPAFTLHQSLIGNNPGVASRPRPMDHISQLIRYNVENASEYQPYIDQLDTYLKPYNVSWYPVKSECNVEENFGYPKTPCLFIKLNKIIDWMPDYYDDVNNLPEEMPEDLKEFIKSLDPSERQQVWVSCAAEVANVSIVQYPWGRGLAGRFYPYRGHSDISPLLPVKITPQANTQIAIRCITWARNIIRNKSLKEPSGYTRILLQMDSSDDVTGEHAVAEEAGGR